MNPRLSYAGWLFVVCEGCVSLGNPDARSLDGRATGDATEAGSDASADALADVTPDVFVEASMDVALDQGDVPVVDAGDVPVMPDAPVMSDVPAMPDAPVMPDVPDVPVMCAAGQIVCAGRCVDTARDAANCGTCGHACGADQTCFAGACIPGCPDGRARCNDDCFDLGARFPMDYNHCGGCDIECIGGQRCLSGACQCPVGYSLCGTGVAARCLNLQDDPSNCGTCGRTCLAGQECYHAACVPSGPNCGGRYPNYQHDPANCGRCGVACTGGTVCSGGLCEPTCGGSTNCGGGCWSTQYDAETCGGCGMACSNVNVESPRCDHGVCSPQCREGFTDCTHDARRNGCETDLWTDRSNCGTCNNVCAAQQVCISGVCVGCSGLNQTPCSGGSCNAGLTLCAGRCRDLTNDARNCGGCGTSCPGPVRCVAGRCA